MGATLYAYHCLLTKPRRFILKHAYWGKEYSGEQIEGFLKKNNINYRFIEDEDKLVDLVVEALVSGKVIGWF